MKTKREISRFRATLHGRYWRHQLAQIRHCVQCGGVLKTSYVKEEKRRRRRCVGCQAITYVNPKVVAGCIALMPNGHVVLLQRAIEPAKGKWSYPAGFMEMGETVEEAAVRETREEIGVRVKLGQRVGVYSYPDAGVVTVVFVGYASQNAKPHVTEEATDIKIVAPSKIPWKDLAFRSSAHALMDWLKGKNK